MTSNNLLAVAAAVQGLDDASLEALASTDNKGLSPKMIHSPRLDSTSLLMTGNDSRRVGEVKSEHVLTEGAALGETGVDSSKARNRRASEGALLKGDGKRISGELRCNKCGKNYKHSSCLTKHLLVSLISLRMTSRPVRCWAV